MQRDRHREERARYIAKHKEERRLNKKMVRTEVGNFGAAAQLYRHPLQRARVPQPIEHPALELWARQGSPKLLP